MNILKRLWKKIKFDKICEDTTKKCHYRNSFMSYYPGLKKWSFIVEPSYGDDNNLQVHFGTIIGQFFIELPIKTTFKDDYYRPELRYGFYFYSVGRWFPDEIVFCYGKESKTIYFPWNMEWYRTSLLLNDNTWEHETKGNYKEFYHEKWDEKKFVEQHYYKYVPDGIERKIQRTVATISVNEREWRPRWFMWTKMFAMVRKTIDVEFAHEIGERVGTYKGGTIGCSYDMLPGETPEQTLRRMEKERRFK